MSSRLRNLAAAGAFAFLETPQGALGLAHRVTEASDPALVDLRVRNLSEAIAQGSQDAEARLGVLIGRALCEGQELSHGR